MGAYYLGVPKIVRRLKAAAVVKKDVIKIFANFTGKHSVTGVFLRIWRNF